MSRENMLWWRAHHGLPSHQKWLRVARKCNKPVPVVFSVAMWLLDHASRSADRGSVSSFDPGACAAFLWIDEADVQTVVAALEAIGWLQDGAISTWGERQAAYGMLRAKREIAKRFSCPRCGAGAKSPCVRENGDIRIACHQERHSRAAKLLSRSRLGLPSKSERRH